MTLDHDEKVRLSIWGGLIWLSARLANYPQTTHALVMPATIDDVAKYLAKAYKEPTAYNLSNLSQAIQSLR